MAENRLDKAAKEIQERLDTIDDSAKEKLSRDLAIDFQEHFAYQTAQSRAFAMGRLSQGEAQFIYVSLGEIGSDNNGGWAEGTTLAAKVAITKVMLELIS